MSGNGRVRTLPASGMSPRSWPVTSGDPSGSDLFISKTTCGSDLFISKARVLSLFTQPLLWVPSQAYPGWAEEGGCPLMVINNKNSYASLRTYCKETLSLISGRIWLQDIFEDCGTLGSEKVRG